MVILDQAAAQSIERRENRRVFEAQAEAQELVRRAAKDGTRSRMKGFSSGEASP